KGRLGGRDAGDDVLGLFGGEAAADQVVGADPLEGAGGIDAHVDQAAGDGLVQAEGLDQGGDGVAARIVAGGLELLDVDAPADQAGGEPGVLALAPDGDGQVVGRDLEDDAVILVVDDDLARHGGLEGLDHHLARVREVLDDVDLLAAELADDGLHASAAGADAGAHRVDLLVAAGDRDLGAVARLPGEGLDLDGAVGDLGDLELEEAADELGAGAGQDDLRAAGRVLDLEQERADAVARLVFLARDLLAGRHHRLGLAQVHEDVIALPPADRAGHDVADLVLEVVVDAVLLELPQALHHRLPGGLGRDPAERGGVDRALDHLAEHGAGLHRLGLLDMDLRPGVADRIDHLQDRPGLELAVLGVDVDPQLLA